MKKPGNIRCCMVKNGDGRVLKVLPTRIACVNWIRKHFGDESVGLTVTQYRSGFAVSDEFDRQMQIGTTDGDVIACMLWYGGVSRTCAVDGSGHFVGEEKAREIMKKRHRKA